jgi:hypothetical protein
VVAGHHRTKVITRHEWVFDDGVPIGEVFKALASLKQEAEGCGVKTQYDDWLHIEGDGESIILVWESRE